MEQLSKVDPTCMNCDERLAFWINLYNTLIMHVSIGSNKNVCKCYPLDCMEI